MLEVTDIVAVIGESVELKASGQNYKALCPFHQERTPSFMVNPARRTWHCFGRCGEGGNVVDFVMRREGMEFWPALCMLAQRGGVSIPDRDGSDDGGAKERGQLLALNAFASEFYAKALACSREGEDARLYVEKRGITHKSIDTFSLGYAPLAGNHLLHCLERRGVALDQAEAAGLVVKGRDGRYRDRFFGRLMFPIRSAFGDVVGFGGRSLDGERQPKYLNTPETALFKKRELLYGLFEGKVAIRSQGRAGLVEGYTDVIMAHQADQPWLVATLGTAFGEPHVRLLRRYAQRLLFVFDADAAGLQAASRALQRLSQAVFAGSRPFSELAVAQLPPGCDPADLIVNEGAEAFAEALASACGVLEFLVPAGIDQLSVPERREAAQQVITVLAAFDDGLERELQLSEVARRLRLPESVVRELASSARRSTSSVQPTTDIEESCEDGLSATKQPTERLDLFFIQCLLACPQLRAEAAGALAEGLVEKPLTQRVAEEIIAGVEVADIADDETRKYATAVSAAMEDQFDFHALWEDVLARLRERRDRKQVAKLCASQPSDDALRAVFEAQKRLKARHLYT